MSKSGGNGVSLVARKLLENDSPERPRKVIGRKLEVTEAAVSFSTVLPYSN